MITLPESSVPRRAAQGAPPPGSPDFQRRLQRCVERCSASRPVALAHLEVAGAWDVRDAGGTEAVGALREAVVRELKDFMDDGIVFASIGLCGFTMLLEDRHLRRALNDVRELKHAVDTLCFYWHGHPFRLSAYAGVVELGPDRAEPRRWLARAQEACAAARELGGDGVQVVEFNEHAWSDIARNREWVRHLSEIIG